MTEDFIHCNNCLTLPLSGIQYYLTQCSKIYCQKCVQLFKNNCNKCAPNVCQHILLNENIRPEIELCFRDLSYSLKKLVKVETFQNSQRIHLKNKLFDQNRQLKNQLISQKELIINLQNENKSLKTIIENTNNETFGENQSIHTFNRNIKKEKKSLFKNLFSNESKSQMSFNINETQENNAMIKTNMNNTQQMVSNNSTNRKPLSPLQSIRGSRITLKPNYSLRNVSDFSGHKTQTIGQQINNQSNGFNTTPITVSSHQSLASFASSATTRTSFNRVYPQTTPSTGYSSIPSLSSFRIGDRNTPKVYPFSTNH